MKDSGSAGRNSSVEADFRRQALRRYGRRIATGFFVGTICLFAFFLLTPWFHDPLESLLGETTFFWLYAISAFASLVVPNGVVMFFALGDGWLYCPNCGNDFTNARSARHINQHSQCKNCKSPVEISPVKNSELRFDLCYMLGGLWLLCGIGFMMIRFL